MTLPPNADAPAPPRAEGATHDRGISPIAGRFGGRSGKLVTVAALILGGGVLLAASWERGEDPGPATAQSDAAPRELSPFEPARRGEALLLTEADGDPLAPQLAEPVIPPIEDAPSAPSVGASSTVDSRQALADSARRAPLLAYSRPGHAEPPTAAGPAELPSSATSPTVLDGLRQGTPIGRAAAGRLPDRNLLITAGTSLPCVLQTAMDSSLPGLVSCVLPRDIYSESGGVVLLERGTRVLGEYQGGLQQGRRRLFVLWTRAVTPTGVSMALASPAADGLGRSGFDGAVDVRFWDRFGGGLLLSLVDDGASAAFGEDNRGDARLPSDAAAVALQGSIDIPATLRKAQGSEVSIFVAQDLDFRSVYRLRAR